MVAPVLPCCLLSLSLSSSTCTQEPEPPTAHIERHVAAMGTTLEIRVAAESREEALLASEECLEALAVVERRISTWRPDTELARLNQAAVGEVQPLSSELAADLAEIRPWWSATHSAFDPGIGALVQAWGLRTGGRLPNAPEIAAAIVPGGFAMLELIDGGAIRLHASLIIDEGAFGKGLGLERAVEALQHTRASSAVLDLGGQIAVFGTDTHRIAIADPRDRARPVLEFCMDGGSVSTSSNSERGVSIDGVRVGHLLDPRTGYPAADFGSLTVWCQSATAADCLSTGLFVLGPDAALEFAAEYPEIRVLVLEIRNGGLAARASANFATRLFPLVADLLVDRTSGTRAEIAPAPSHSTSCSPPTHVGNRTFVH